MRCGLVICAGLIFQFGFMKIFQNMNKHNIQTPEGLKKVKVVKANKKNVSDEIKIEKL